MEKENLKNVLKKLAKLFILFIVVFAIINLLIFGKIVLRESRNTINKEARIYLASAYAINKLYIFPLSNTFGFLSPITKPFYMVRNGLYKIGMSKLAADDGEREWWWGRIKEQEFVELYMQAMFDWNYQNVLPRKKADELLRMEDEVYTHLLRIPNAKPYDKNLAKEKYLMFIETGYRYATYVSYLPHEFLRDYKVDYTDRQIVHFKKVYGSYLKYSDYARVHEKESIQFVPKNNELAVREHAFTAQLLRILFSTLSKNNNLGCNNPYFKYLAISQQSILNYIIKNNTNNRKMTFDSYCELSAQTLPFHGYKSLKLKCDKTTGYELYNSYINNLTSVDINRIYYNAKGSSK